MINSSIAKRDSVLGSTFNKNAANTDQEAAAKPGGGHT
jgi:hypothetical protein|tara:strand:+ start:82 stop:195 length:114 start_codon:yes stop_codon:yes gene_type:complete